ncbi:MAG TPA: hypothetical protein VJ798_10175 [Rhizomicrobium sp.]|nr:hypothetical protein [Rhizomicrobium sp.]
MSLLREVQTALMDGKEIGPILLKLQFLASRLGSDVLEEWVKHESEGYQVGVEAPDYRKVPVTFTGHFSGPFGSGIKNAPIPSVLVKKLAGEAWTNYEIRQGMASIDNMLSSASKTTTLNIDASNLILKLQGKIYPDYACNGVDGEFSMASLVEIQNAVRARALELTLKIEKSVPAAADITIGPSAAPKPKDTEAVTQITNQVIYGNYTAISNTGAGAQFSLSISSGDAGSVIKGLEAAGFPNTDAKEIATILASEKPENEAEPFGKKAKAWIAKNLVKATNGAWSMGISVATQLLTEAAKKYYGLP